MMMVVVILHTILHCAVVGGIMGAELEMVNSHYCTITVPMLS